MKTGTGIEITGSGIHYVELEKTLEGYKLLSALTIPTEIFSEDFAGSINSDTDSIVNAKEIVARHFNSGAINNAGIIGFSGNGLILRYSRVMPAPTKRQQMLIDFEIQEMTAHGKEDLISAYRKLSIQSPGGEDTILVSLAKDEYLEGINSTLRKVGFTGKYFSPSCVALYNNLMMSGQIINKESVMVVAIDKDTTELVIVEDGFLIFARNLNTGGKLFLDVIKDKKPNLPTMKAWNYLLSKGDITPPVSGGEGSSLQVSFWGAGEELFRMLESSINFARLQLRKPRLDIRKIFITGELANLKGIKEFMTSRFQRTVELLNPLQDFSKKLLSKTIGKKQTMMFARNPYPYAVAAGLAKMAVDDEPFNLVMKPKSYHRRMKFIYQTMFLYLTMIALVVTLAFRVIHYDVQAEAAEKAKKSLIKKSSSFKKESKKLIDSFKESTERAPIGKSLQDAIEPSISFYKLCRIVREYANENTDIIIQSIIIEPFAENVNDSRDSKDEKTFTKSKLNIKIHFEDIGAKPLEQLNKFKKYLKDTANIRSTSVAFEDDSLQKTKCYIVTIEL
ncbi:MAG: hypothetical protein K8S87_00270 [Planctomycetes bacterium]|nr:hypothetical protein [Planctomycetota bacterium]